MQNLAHY